MRMRVEGGLQVTIPIDELDLSVSWIKVDVDSRLATTLLDRSEVQSAEVHDQIRLPYERIHASCSWAVLDAMFHIDENLTLAEPQPVEETASCRNTVVIHRAKIIDEGVECWRVVACILVKPDIIPQHAQPEEVVCYLPGVPPQWATHQIARQHDPTSLSRHGSIS